MDIVLIIVGLVLCVVGIFGTFLPVLPGVSLSWLGLLLLHLTGIVEMNYWLLGITLVVTIILSVLDYVIPAMGTKKYGGSKAGAIGTTVGLIVGIFVPIPFAVLICPFLGAFIAEIIVTKSNSQVALKAAFGSFIGFLASTFISFFTAIVFLGIYLYVCWEYRSAIGL